MLIGQGSTTETLSDRAVAALLAQAFDDGALDGKRVLVIIPDGTRTAPIPLMVRLLHEQLGTRVARLDYLIALGTHPPMSDEAIARLVGVPTEEWAARYPNSKVYNHRWELPEHLVTLGILSKAETLVLTDGLVAEEVPVTINRMVLDYDQLLICGPVFPHEVVGYSGGAKYLYPGIAGAEIINFTHWLGALVSSMYTIGVKETPMRRVIHRAAEFVPTPILCLKMVMQGHDLHGLFIGSYLDAWSAAADLSSQLNVVTRATPYRRVLSMPSEIYDDLWTAAKAMYKTEPVIADGGEVIIYAPHITEISYTHGKLIDEIGYHVLEYFTKQGDRFKDVPGGILAHSTHVKGRGTFDPDMGIESPRIHVALATGIPEARCRQVNLGYVDYRTLNPADWANREAEGILLVPHAGEMLYRSEALFPSSQ